MAALVTALTLAATEVGLSDKLLPIAVQNIVALAAHKRAAASGVLTAPMALPRLGYWAGVESHLHRRTSHQALPVVEAVAASTAAAAAAGAAVAAVHLTPTRQP